MAACARNYPALRPTETSIRPGPTPTTNKTAAIAQTAEVLETDYSTPGRSVPPLNVPRTLVICMGHEPETLYTYGGSMLAQSSVYEAIYDGPMDNRSFSYQPVVLKKIPNLADGDAIIQPVERTRGDTIVDARGSPVTLEEGVVFRPFGCANSDCGRTYLPGDGAVLLDQMVVTFTLKANLRWSVGRGLTAQDSVYGYNLELDPDVPMSRDYFNWRTASYEAVDSRRVVWTGLPGYVDSTYHTNFWSPLPEHSWRQYTAGELIDAEVSAEKPIGWGPYRIVDWLKGDHIRLERNPYYHRADEGLPYFDIPRILRHPIKEGKMEIRESSFFAKNGAIQADFSSFLCQNRHVRAHW